MNGLFMFSERRLVHGGHERSVSASEKLDVGFPLHRAVSPSPHVAQGSPALSPKKPHSPEKPQAGTHLTTRGKEH